jgi:phenylpropionate dioxygenase-like ring-hydroxylating dioxygenase large terminal subunit
MTAIDEGIRDPGALAKGMARSPGISYQELLDQDTHPVPDVLRLQSPKYFGSEDVSIERYTTRAWHEKETEKLWKRVWQMACREEHIPSVGDYIVYNIVNMSFIVIRTKDGIKAYPNACLHRGRRLKDYDGHCSEIRCNFHGFAWTTEGKLQDVPARWDFPHIEDENFCLPEVKVGTWGGFVFINPDLNAEPLEDFVRDLAEQFDSVWDLRNYYVEAHVAKVIQANWKIVQEAFCEAYHVNATHPQIMVNLGDTNSQVDIWENCARVITPGGTSSPLLDWSPTENEKLRAMLDLREDQVSPFTLEEGQSMRAFAANLSRENWRPKVGDRVDQMSDAEFLDALDYTLFPNLHPWGAFNRICYRFRPNGDDHRSALMECFYLAPVPADGERPPPAPMHLLEEHETWTDAPELGMLGKVFNQDLFNMAKVQLGLETTYKPGITLANYQESKVRWLHHKLGQWVEGDETPVSVRK